MVLTGGTCGDASSSRFSAARRSRGRVAARAQQPGKVYRIGFLWDSPDAFPDALEAFRQGLRDLGYVEGRNIAIEYRSAEGKRERMRELAEELVRLKVDVIVVQDSPSTPRQRNGRPRRSPSSSLATRTRSPPVTRPASRGRAATSPASPS